MVYDIDNNFTDRQFWSPSQREFDLGYVRHTTLHILKSGVVCALVRSFGDCTLRPQGLNDLESQIFNGDLMVIADVEGLSDRFVGVDHGDDSSDGVIDMAEAAGLFARAIDR